MANRGLGGGVRMLGFTSHGIALRDERTVVRVVELSHVAKGEKDCIFFQSNVSK